MPTPTTVGGDMDIFATWLRTLTVIGILALVVLYPDILNGLLSRFNSLVARVVRLGQPGG